MTLKTNNWATLAVANRLPFSFINTEKVCIDLTKSPNSDETPKSEVVRLVASVQGSFEFAHTLCLSH